MAGVRESSSLDPSVRRAIAGAVDQSSSAYIAADAVVTAAFQAADALKQPLDADLTTIAGLTATTDNFIQAKSSAWASRTPAQVAADLVVEVGKLLFPVGAIYAATVSTNPGTLLGFGTWTAYGEGRVMVGKAAAGTFATGGATGGAETHTLTTAEIPSHAHQQHVAWGAGSGAYASWSGGSANALYGLGNNGSTGGGGSHNNLQPYIVTYLWQRTA